MSEDEQKRRQDSSNDRYARYVDGLLRQYDKDRDGKLSKAELSKMRRPPVGADTNNDGMVSRDEYIDNVPGKASSQPSEKSKSDSTGVRDDVFIRHAERLLKLCDEDKDQRLSKTELKIMLHPPDDADKNGDGYVDKAELIEKVMESAGVAPDKTSSSKKPAAKNPSSPGNTK